MGRLLPTRSISRSCRTRSSAIWISGGKSPISSRKIVPPFADSKRPSRRCVAPVKAPFSWPKSSEAISEGGIAAQFTPMNARSARLDRLWIARAISSFPVPVSPKIKTVESEGATFAIFGLLAILDVGRRCEPPDNVSVFSEYGVVAKEEPPKLAIFTQQPLFHLE